MEVNAGEIVGIMGPSGSGKTTLLNCIGGLDQPTAGKITVGNINVTNLDTNQLNEFRRTYVGHIFQTQNLIPTLTARENVELPMIAASTPRSKRRERSEMLLNVVNLMERGNHKPDELSGGERQRIALATALANDPPLILGDEPTGELDSVNSKIIVDFLLKVNKEFGKTVLIVSHDANVARACRRILRIEDGVITSQYTPAQLVEKGTSVGYVDQIRSSFIVFKSSLISSGS